EDFFFCQNRRLRRRELRHVVRRQNSQHPGHFQRIGGVDVADPGVRHGAAQQLAEDMPSARKSSAYFALPGTLATTSGGMKFLPTSLYATSTLPRRAHDASEIMIVGTAAA